MKAAILSIGTEILQGTIVDTNAAFLAQELTALGVEVLEVTQARDDWEQLERAFRRALDDADVVVSTGGIGPTGDDLTREIIAAIRGETPSVDATLSADLEAIFTSRGIAMPENNRKQAWLIPSATSLPNPFGTAPGWFVQHGRKAIIALPGPPRENQPMWRNHGIPLLAEMLTGQVIVARTLKTIGIGESAVEREIMHVIAQPYPVTATYAKADGVNIRITALATNWDDAASAVAAAESAVRERISQFIYGEDDLSLSGAILGPLARAGTRLALWEAGSAGQLVGLLQGDLCFEEMVSEARVSTYQHAVAELGEHSSVETLASSMARFIGQQAGSPMAAAVALRATTNGPLKRVPGEIGVALAFNRETISGSYQITATIEDLRRRTMLHGAEFLWKTIPDAITCRTEK
jgi:nicotinamide-nucleotide amidase